MLATQINKYKQHNNSWKDVGKMLAKIERTYITCKKFQMILISDKEHVRK